MNSLTPSIVEALKSESVESFDPTRAFKVRFNASTLQRFNALTQ
jgi:hypothetical protein